MKKNCTIIFFSCLTIFLANGRAHPEVDCVAAPYMAWSIINYFSYDLKYYEAMEKYEGGAVKTLSNGSRVSIRSPGSAIAALPILAPLALISKRPPQDGNMHLLGKLTAAISVAGASVIFFLICKLIVPIAAWPTTILFALGTCLYSVASQALWMHGPATFWLCLALWFLIKRDKKYFDFCAGLALGFAVLTRPTTAFFAIATLTSFYFQKKYRGIFRIILGGLIPALIMFHYNFTNFDNTFLGGYENDNWSESPPIWLGLGGLLVAPSRGLFIYSPALLLSIPGAYIIFRNSSEKNDATYKLLSAWIVSAIITIFFYARWHDWKGGWCYGPRFLCEIMPICCLCFAFAYEKLFGSKKYLVGFCLIFLSVSIHLVGVFGYSGYASWQIRHAISDQGRNLFEFNDTQIEAHAKALYIKILKGFGHSPLN